MLVLVVDEGLHALRSKQCFYLRSVTCSRSLDKLVPHLLYEFLLTV
jgi:hypothetical protein